MYVIIYRLSPYSSLKANNMIYEDRDKAETARVKIIMEMRKDGYPSVQAWKAYFEDPRL